ncbi:MAG: hypothetical protein V1775_12390 [Bacteroidota bacterium]
MLLTLLTGCSHTGIYSVIVSNPGIQHEQNDLNDLGDPYKKKKLVFPASVVLMSNEEKSRWLDTLKQYRVHTIDTSIKIGFIKTPGLAELKIPACGKKGVAIIMLKDLGTRKKGKIIDIEICYVCKYDNPDFDWASPGRFWAATNLYKIDVKDPCFDCYDGFQSVEFQFAPEKENPVLRSVLISCAKE